MSFTLEKGSTPRKKSSLAAETGVHYVIRVKSKEPCVLDFAIYDSSKPLKIPIGKNIIFGLSKGDS